jgi:DnaJ-class molecular chaperone
MSPLGVESQKELIMLFFQGSWYCTQCGHEYISYQAECKNCEGEDFSDQPMIERSNNEEQIQIEMDLGMEIF